MASKIGEETKLATSADEKARIVHTTAEDASHLKTVVPPAGHHKPILAESVAPVKKKELPEKFQFPNLMTKEEHLEAAKRYREMAEEWKAGKFNDDHFFNMKRHNELLAKARYHEALAEQPPGTEVTEIIHHHPNPEMPPGSRLTSHPRGVQMSTNKGGL